MVKIIGRAQRLGTNRQIHGVINENLNLYLNTSHHHDKSIKNIILESE